MNLTTIIKWARKEKNRNLALLYIWNEWRRHKEKYLFQKNDDKTVTSKMYEKKLGHSLDLENPKLFTEKLNWLKLFYRDPLMTQCADKYGVRAYVQSCGLESILNPLVGVYEDVNDIDFDSLPNMFVLKGTHGSGWNIICKDKSSLDIKRYKRIMKSWLKQNTYYSGREWVYHYSTLPE